MIVWGWVWRTKHDTICRHVTQSVLSHLPAFSIHPGLLAFTHSLIWLCLLSSTVVVMNHEFILSPKSSSVQLSLRKIFTGVPWRTRRDLRIFGLQKRRGCKCNRRLGGGSSTSHRPVSGSVPQCAALPCAACLSEHVSVSEKQLLWLFWVPMWALNRDCTAYWPGFYVF